MMLRTILGGLLGGFSLYIVGFLFWGTPLSALAFNRADPQASANLQAAMAQALTGGGTGVYVIPDPSTAQGTILYGKGPVAMLFYNQGGFPVADGTALVGGLVLALITGVLIAFALRAIAGDLPARMRILFFFSLASVLWLHIGQAVFNHAPWRYILYLAISDFIALMLAGFIAVRLMEGRRTGARPDATLH